MTVWMVVRKAPPLPFLPKEVHGQLVLIVPFVFLGDREHGETLIEPLRQASPSHGEMIGMHPWTTWQSLFDPLVAHGARNYWKSHHLQDLSDGFIDCALDAASRLPTDECEMLPPAHGGSAEPRRRRCHGDGPSHAAVLCSTSTPAGVIPRTTSAAWRGSATSTLRLEPFARGVYVNFISEEGEDRVKDAYAPTVWSRLVQVKTAWDPGQRVPRQPEHQAVGPRFARLNV